MYTKDNDFGCTKWDGVTDMTETNGTLIQQMEKKGIHYTRTNLNMGALPAEPAYLVHYTSQKSKIPMTILVIPQIGADSWAEDYFYFPGMTMQDAIGLNWCIIYEHVHTVSLEIITQNIHSPSKCPSCGKMDINKSDTYKDIRGKIRCAHCHSIRS